MGLLSLFVIVLGAIMMFSSDEKYTKVVWKSDKKRFLKNKYWKEEELPYCEKCECHHVKNKCK